MPIDYSKYPLNWLTEIRPRILEREEHKCKFCGVPNHENIVRDELGNWHLLEKYAKDHASSSACYLSEQYPGWQDGFKPVKIVLTIAHLDHDEENHDVKDDRLAALCQKCHLKYDAPEKARRRRVKKYSKSLFPLQ